MWQLTPVSPFSIYTSIIRCYSFRVKTGKHFHPQRKPAFRKLWLGESDKILSLCMLRFSLCHCSQLAAWEMQFYQIPDQCFSGFEDSSVSLYLQPIYKQHILTAIIKVQCLCACLYTQCVHCVRETVSEVIRCIYVRISFIVRLIWEFLIVRKICIAQVVCDWTLTRVWAGCRISPVSASEQNCPYDAGSVIWACQVKPQSNGMRSPCCGKKTCTLPF